MQTWGCLTSELNEETSRYKCKKPVESWELQIQNEPTLLLTDRRLPVLTPLEEASPRQVSGPLSSEHTQGGEWGYPAHGQENDKMTKIAWFNMVAHLLRRTMSNTEMLHSHLKALGLLLVGVPRHPLPLQQQLCSALQRLPTFSLSLTVSSVTIPPVFLTAHSQHRPKPKPLQPWPKIH